MNKFLCLLCIYSLPFITVAQKPFEAGVEYIRAIGQGYNAAKVGVRGETYSNKNSFSIGITYQLASKKSYSVSQGFGIYAGYRYAFGSNTSGSNIFAGARILVSLENFEGQTRSNSILITPMAEAGYHLVFKTHYFASPSLGYGYTINFSKDYHSLDEDQGKRFLPSLSAGYRF